MREGLVPALVVALVVATSAVSASDLTADDLARFDQNGDGSLGPFELVSYFQTADKVLEEARKAGYSDVKLVEIATGWAVDAITAFCDDCEAIPLEAAPPLLAALPRTIPSPSAKKKTYIGWKGLGFKRFVTDPIDPRSWKTGRPLIVGYTRDNEAAPGAKKERFNFFGGIQLYQRTRSKPGGHAFWTVGPGIDLDVDGSKPANETTVAAGFPVTWDWVNPQGGRRFHSGSTLTFSPRFITDRDFDREVWDLGLSWTLNSEVLRAGYFSYFGKPRPGGTRAFRFTWLPTLGLGTGNVDDAAGNETLALLEAQGTYHRARARLSASLRTPLAADRLTIGLDYRHIYDIEESLDRGYGELSLQLDLNKARNAQLTATYRKGRKEPTFAKTDQILFAVGLYQ